MQQQQQQQTASQTTVQVNGDTEARRKVANKYLRVLSSFVRTSERVRVIDVGFVLF